MGLSESTVKVIALAATAAALVAAGAALYYRAQATAAGDEPPIRVKGGSFHLHQFGKNGVWEPQDQQQPDPKKWQIRSHGRGGSDLLVYIAPINPADCLNTVFKKNVKRVKFVYRVGEEDFAVNVHATGNKTKVESPRDLKLGSTGKNEINFDGDGYIKEVLIDNQSVCTFGSKDELDGVIIGEEP